MRKVWMVAAALSVGLGLIGVESARADRPAKDGKVTLRLASDTASRDLEKIKLGERTLYVAAKGSLSAGEVVSTESIASRDGSDVELTLTPAGADRLAELIETYGGDRAVLFSGRKAVVAGALSFDRASGVATITGLSADDADQFTRVIQNRTVIDNGPTMTVMADTTNIAPGDAVTVDVFVSGVPSLRSYQVKLAVSGGTAGRLEFEDLWIDHERTDYVFGTAQKLDAVDRTGARIGGVMMAGGVEALEPRYVGSYTFRASPDAAGTFSINITTQERQSLLLSGDNQELAVGMGPVAAITVGGTTRLPASGR